MGDRTGLMVVTHSGRDWTVIPVRVTGGLALHRTVTDFCPRRACWTITHVASGLAILRHLRPRAWAERRLQILLGLGDWTRSAAVLRALPPRARLAARVRAMQARDAGRLDIPLGRPGGGA